jgi:urease alpha subunit
MFGYLINLIFSAHHSVLGQNCFVFVSKASLDIVKREYGLKKMIEPVKNTRKIGKKDMKWNDTLPNISVDPETYMVTVDGKKVEMGPCDTVPMQSVFLF